MKRFFLLALPALALCLSVAQPVSAANASDWNGGYIIDDAVFYDKGAMNVDTIQAFLNAKVPNCDNWGTQAYAGTTRRAYSEQHGQTMPLICLRDYYENPTTHANNLQGQPIPSGALSAAQIISAAAQNYSINPEVLIVLLQKEQGLVTDDWPWAAQYRSATGYGCPDTAVCDSQYYGFYNQVMNAARQFRLYANNPNAYNFVPNQNNNISYNPNTACGSQSVFIRSQATASLYNYTPYVPNQAALNNLYGTGDSCSSYGNRNFWRYFVDWFGSPYIRYSWETVSQNAYFDQARTMPADLGKLGPGQRYYLTAVVKNTGNVTWQREGANPVHLGTQSPQDHVSPFCDSTWVSPPPGGCNRAAYLHEYSVAPGQYGSFEFWITTPTTSAGFNEVFSPVMENMGWMSSSSLSYPMFVNPADYSGTVLSQNAYTDTAEQTTADIRHLVPGQRYYIDVRVKNTGDMAWQREGANPLHLGTANTRDRTSPFCDTSTWPSCNRASYLHEYTVLPGQVGSFAFWITAPSSGNYTETFAPVVEGQQWLDNLPMGFNGRVEPYSWSPSAIQLYTDSSKQTPVASGNLDPGQRYYASINVQNTGWATWRNNGSNPVTLGTANPRDRNSAICDSTWTSCKRAATLREYTVNSGQTGSFEFWLTAPTTPGSYVESFTPVVEGLNWMGTNTIDIGIKVNPPRYSWDIVSQSAYTDSTKTRRADLGNLNAKDRYYLTLVVKNTGNTTWQQGGVNPTSLGTTGPRDRNSPFCDSTWAACNRAALLHEYSVAPGQYGSFEFWIKAPSNSAGYWDKSYNEIYAPVLENLVWLDDHTASYPMLVHDYPPVF